MSRPIRVIAQEINRDWPKPYFGAVPYLRAMARLETIDDRIGYDDARDIVTRFLVNAGTWRGETARRVKAELRVMSKRK